ncbi:WD repeat-containing protein 87 [Sceloporus undulatus]|uniref:WD repeat-containing protein 87 n=1 Tax=Sceloporus undulatus TaxID=8520 RepID=UPI001C4A87E5|nr:WD repeat-containing protein 87 [Sceloporus undulatus]
MAMLKGPVRIVPRWQDLKRQLMEMLELQKGMPDTTEGAHILLSDRPSIVFRESCYPDYMPPIFLLQSTDTETYFTSFTWRRAKGSQVRVWLYNIEYETSVTEKEYAVTADPMVLMTAHVTHLNLLVAYCNDIHLRFFGDHTQKFTLLSEMSSPYSITSICSNPETGEVVTGAIGIVAFWSIVIDGVPSMKLVQEVLIASGEFVHFLRVEPERRALVALCENNIRVYDYQTKAQIRTFKVSQGVSLTCCSAFWSQGFLYTGDLAGDVKVWDFDKGSLVSQFKAHLSAITSIISRTSVHTLMTASLDGLLKEWNLTTCEQLRRVDIGEQVFQMQFINEQTFFLRTKYTFSIRTVNNFYQLFNRSQSILKKLIRVQCGPDKARILAATEDGVIRFLSPVTGEMLFVTWPFQLLEKALDYVYDPDREELLITMGTNDIYVLDTTQNPCSAKYILRATDSVDDKVLCLAYSRLDLNGRTSSFIFSGYRSGKVRTVTQNLYRMGARRIHDGNVVALSSISASGNFSYHSRESSYLCSYGIDEYIVLSDVILKKNSLLEVVPLVAIPSTNCRINHLLLIPGYICVLTEQNRVRLWRQASLVPGKNNPFWKETSAMHSTSITSFDYCHTLSILVTGGSDGSVRIWDILGQMLVEFDTTLKFSRVCFANQRGDLVVGCNMNIYFIPCITYLPNKYLSRLATQCLSDDIVERPLPFSPRFLLTFDIVFVPKYRQVGKQAKKFERLEPITNHKEVVIEKNVAKVIEFIGKEVSNLPGPDFYGLTPGVKEILPEFAVEYQIVPPSFEKKHAPAEPPLASPPYRGLPRMLEPVPLLHRLAFKPGQSWPIAPDGYVPNSVIRARLFPKGTPTSLTCPLVSSRQPLPTRRMVKIQLSEWDTSEAVEKARKKKAQKLRRQSTIDGHRRRDLLSDIVAKAWFRHKPSDTSLPSVIKAILNLMDDVPYSTYLLCTSALVQLSESYELPRNIQEQAFDRLIQDTNHKEVRMRLAAWEALGKMDLLTDQEVVPLARALLDDNKKLRDLARSLLDSVAGITDKFVLKQEMQRLAETSLDDLVELSRSHIEPVFPRRVRAAGIVADSHDAAIYALTEEAERLMKRVENQLTANLFLLTECPPIETRSARPPRLRHRSMSQGAPEESAKPDSHLEAQTRWLGLFAKQEKIKAAASGKHKREKLPRIPQAHGKPVVLPSGVAAPEGSPTPSSLSSTTSDVSSSSSTTSIISDTGTGISSTMWQEAQQTKKEIKTKEKRQKTKAPLATSQEARKAPKASKRMHPILLQRRDTRTQLYTEMLKQKFKKEQVAVTAPVETKPEVSPIQPKPSQPLLPSLPPPPVKGILIDPQQQYSTDRSRWRNDLYKLMMLRISPVGEGHTVADDLLSSARIALAGRTMSWEAFTNISQSLLTSQEKGTAESTGWKKYMDELFKASFKDLKPSMETMETVLDVKKEGRLPRGSESDIESSDISQEDLVRERRKEGRMRKVRERELEPAASDKRIGVVSKMQGARKMMERQEKLTKKIAKEGKAPKLKDHEISLEADQELVAKGKQLEVLPEKEREVSWGKEPEVSWGKERKVSWGKDREVSRGKEPEVSRGKEREVTKGKEREVTKGKELEVTKGKELEVTKGKELEAAKGKEHEAPKEKEREGARAKEREATGKRREREGVPERKEREVARKKPGKVTDKIREGKVKFLEEKEEESEVMRLDSRSVQGEKPLVKESERALLQMSESTLAELRAEAKERMMAELKERALVEAQKVALEEMKERALAEARDMALEEARNWVLLQARKMTLVEAWEKALEDAREKAMGEVMEKALAAAREQALAEVQEMGLTDEAEAEATLKEMVRELTESIAREMAEERAMEIALTTSLEVDEARVLELAETEMLEVDEARILELAEARLKELTEARTMELAEEKVTELSESTIMELIEAKMMEIVEEKMEEVEAEEEEMAARKASIAGEEELISGKKGLISHREGLISGRKKLISDEEEADMWEDLEEEDVWALSEDETEALITAYEHELVSGAELDFSERAHLILDILTEPDKLVCKGPEGFQRLCQVVSLFQICATTDTEALEEALVAKAEETIQEGEKQQAFLPEAHISVLEELKETVHAYQLLTVDPRQFAINLNGLLNAAKTVLQAKKLKEKLEKQFWSKRWKESAERTLKKTLEAGEGKVRGKKFWLSKKLKDAIRRWKLEQERSQWEKLKQQRMERHLKFRSQPIKLHESETEKAKERENEMRQKQKAEEEQQKKAEPPIRRKQVQMTWSMVAQREKTWKVVMQLEKQIHPPAEEPRQPPTPKGYRLPKNSLYLTTKLTPKLHRRNVRRGARQHIFHLDDDKDIDWDRFTYLYQSVMSLKAKEGGVDSQAWQQQVGKLLDLYATSNPLIRTMVQQLLMGGRHQSQYVLGTSLKMRKGKAELGQRILCELVHHSARTKPPKPPTLHGIIPLNYQNNVHPFRLRGVTHYGTLAFMWKAYMPKGKMPKLHLNVHADSTRKSVNFDNPV